MPRAIWSEFARGLIQPSLQAVAIMLAVPAILFTSLAVFITPTFMASDASVYFSTGFLDDYLEVTAGALALSRSEEDAPIVMIVGASDTRESIRNHNKISETVFSRTGVRPKIYQFSAGGLTLWEMAALIEMIEPNRQALIVIGIGAGRLAFSESELDTILYSPRLGFHSKVLHMEAEHIGLKLPRAMGNYFFDNNRFFLPRMRFLIKNLLTNNPKRRVMNRYVGRAPVSQKRWRIYEKEMRKRAEAYAANAEKNLAVLERILTRVAERPGHRAVVLVPPKNPRDVGGGVWQRLYEKYFERMQEFTREQGVPLWRLDAHVGIKQADFFGAHHIDNPETQHRYRAVLSERIADVFADIEPAKVAP